MRSGNLRRKILGLISSFFPSSGRHLTWHVTTYYSLVRPACIKTTSSSSDFRIPLHRKPLENASGGMGENGKMHLHACFSLNDKVCHLPRFSSHSAMLSMLPFQSFALLFLIFGSLTGSDHGVGDTSSQLLYDGMDGLGNLELPSTNEASAASSNSGGKQQSLDVPATLQSDQCHLENNKIPSGKRRRRQQLPQFCPQPLAPTGEAHQQQRQDNNGDLKINTGSFRGRRSKKPDPNFLPDVLIISPEREQKRPEDICPPTHPPINGVIPLTIPLCALDQYARPDTHVGFAGMYALENCNPCTLYSFYAKGLLPLTILCSFIWLLY